jgi:hypothetical protein
VHLLGKSADKQITVRGTVASDLGDAGYNSTAIMITECALVLVLQEQSVPVKGGVLTSAAALGMPAVERLRKAGFTMSVAEAKALRRSASLSLIRLAAGSIRSSSSSSGVRAAIMTCHAVYRLYSVASVWSCLTCIILHIESAAILQCDRSLIAESFAHACTNVYIFLSIATPWFSVSVDQTLS